MDLCDFLAVLEQLKIVFQITAVDKLDIKTLHLPSFYDTLKKQIEKTPAMNVIFFTRGSFFSCSFAFKRVMTVISKSHTA